jgi:hypothetical protein
MPAQEGNNSSPLEGFLLSICAMVGISSILYKEMYTMNVHCEALAFSSALFL